MTASLWRGGKKEEREIRQSGLKPARPLLLAKGVGLAESFLQASTYPIQTPARRHRYRQVSASTLWRTHEGKGFLPPLLKEFCHLDRFFRVTFQPISRRMTTLRPLLTHLFMGTKPYIFIQNTDRCPVLALRLSEALLPPSPLRVPPTRWPLLERNICPVKHALTD